MLKFFDRLKLRLLPLFCFALLVKANDANAQGIELDESTETSAAEVVVVFRDSDHPFQTRDGYDLRLRDFSEHLKRIFGEINDGGIAEKPSEIKEALLVLAGSGMPGEILNHCSISDFETVSFGNEVKKYFRAYKFIKTNQNSFFESAKKLVLKNECFSGDYYSAQFHINMIVKHLLDSKLVDDNSLIISIDFTRLAQGTNYIIGEIRSEKGIGYRYLEDLFDVGNFSDRYFWTTTAVYSTSGERPIREIGLFDDLTLINDLRFRVIQLHKLKVPVIPEPPVFPGPIASEEEPKTIEIRKIWIYGITVVIVALVTISAGLIFTVRLERSKHLKNLEKFKEKLLESRGAFLSEN